MNKLKLYENLTYMFIMMTIVILAFAAYSVN